MNAELRKAALEYAISSHPYTASSAGKPPSAADIVEAAEIYLLFLEKRTVTPLDDQQRTAA